MDIKPNHLTTIENRLELPDELTDTLQKKFGVGTYKIDQVYENLPANMSGPGEPRWWKYSTVITVNGDLSKSLVGIYKELMFVDGPSGKYEFISIRDF